MYIHNAEGFVNLKEPHIQQDIDPILIYSILQHIQGQTIAITDAVAAITNINDLSSKYVKQLGTSNTCWGYRHMRVKLQEN